MAPRINMVNKPPIGLIILDALKKQNQTRPSLVKKCDLTPGQISHIINGKSRPSIKTLIKISDAIHVDRNILLNSISK